MRLSPPSARRQMGRLVAIFLALALAGFSSAHAAVMQTVVRHYSSGDQRFVADVLFDAPVCLAAQERGTLGRFQAPATSILQTRVTGSTVSIVLDTSADTTTCITSSVLTIFMPPLVPGAYTLRVADSKRYFNNFIYGNNEVQRFASASFTVPSTIPTPIAVFLKASKFGTELTTSDSGAYQDLPVFASDTGRWQPVFYAWEYRFENDYDGLAKVFTLATRIPGLSERLVYTIDYRERNALIATGAFVDTDSGSNIGVFAAIPASGGACPPSRVPIYRAFEPKAVIHRYVPAATYSFLLGNGWVGDGIAFCVASGPTDASAWAPN